MLALLFYVLMAALTVTTQASRLSGKRLKWLDAEESKFSMNLMDFADEIVLNILRFLCAFEHVQLSMSCHKFNTFCESPLKPLKCNDHLSLYHVYGMFKSSTGYEKDSLRHLLLTNENILDLKESLLEDGPFQLSSPVNKFFKKLSMHYDELLGHLDISHPLYDWIITSSNKLTTDLIRIVVEYVNFAEFNYSVLFRLFARYELSHSLIKQFLVSLHNRYPSQRDSLISAYHEVLKMDWRPSHSTFFSLIDILRVLDIKNSLNFDPSDFRPWLYQKLHFQLFTILIDLFSGSSALRILHENRTQYQLILLHAPQDWCSDEDRLHYALNSIHGSYSTGEFLRKLEGKIKVVSMSSSFSEILIRWINESYPESHFEMFMHLVNGFQASTQLWNQVFEAHYNLNFPKWKPNLSWEILKSTNAGIRLNGSQLMVLSIDWEPHIFLCFATCSEKKLWLLRKIMEMKIPAMMIKHIVLSHRKEFLNSNSEISVAEQHELSRFGKENGYDDETLEFIRERIFPKHPAKPRCIPDCHETKDWHEIACSHLSFIKAASTVLPAEKFQTLLLYDPARWCDTEEAVHLAMTHLRDEGSLLHFLDCLPRRNSIKISKQAMMLVCRSEGFSSKILLKLLEKFPTTQCEFDDPVAYRPLFNHMATEERILLHQHGFWITLSQIKDPIEIIMICANLLQTLVHRGAPTLVIKFFCCLRDFSMTSKDFENLLKLAEDHPDNAELAEFFSNWRHYNQVAINYLQ